MWAQLAQLGGSLLGGVVTANQARQDKKGAMGKQAQATRSVEDERKARDPYRAGALDKLTHPAMQDFSSDYAGTPTYAAVSPEASATAAPVRSNMEFRNGQWVDANTPTFTTIDAPGASYSDVRNRGLDDTVTKSLASLTDAPDRYAMAKSAMDDWEASNKPAFEEERRAIAGNASALGRIGNQGEATSIGRAFGREATARGNARNAALREAQDATQGDKIAALTGARGVAGDIYGRAAGERGAANDVALANRSNQVGERSYRDTLLSAAGNQDKYLTAEERDAGRYLTDQAKGERSYKDTLAEQKVKNAADQREAERIAGVTEFGKGTTLAGIGFGGPSVADAYGKEAAVLSGNAAQSSADAGNFFSGAGMSLADLMNPKAPTYTADQWKAGTARTPAELLGR